ncbi:MAG: DNA helicase UvrD [Acidiphilium sp. 37-64-53]|uniref:ATP-dependent helicase n=1 Tax=Acidiphilium TaxID=522 RepID=UPI000BCC5F2B|nr:MULTISPECIES: UvrD-helicase domain-containing protein [Acidiphilium]OYW01042.1 MAG: DNA helicase UvrD [Acidiphilium sp. 37-64-53]HQT85054.1 UvrD-helicase domain-containing protein [Acidiphilium rubrum]
MGSLPSAAGSDDHPITSGDRDPFADLTDSQRDAVWQDGPVLVLAGAGTGKTKTLAAAIVRRIRYGGISPSRVLAVTFTNKAAREMTARIEKALGAGTRPKWVGTFHGLCARQLRAEPEIASLRPDFEIYDADDSRRVVRRVLKAGNIEAVDGAGGSDPDLLKQICGRIARFKDNLIAPEDAAVRVEGLIAQASREGKPVDPIGMRAAVGIYQEYQRYLRDANAADFGDLILWPTLAMSRNAAYRARWADRFDCVLADEYQDVCFAQYRWINLLAGTHRQLFCVGDDDQAIFGWRGSDIRYLRRFLTDYPRGSQVRLEENFRSTGLIIAAANAVIAHDRERMGKTLFTRKPAGHPIEVVRFRDGTAEADGIVDRILCRHGEGARFGTMAVLYRSNFQSRAIEESLIRSRVPYVLVGDVGFYQRAEIKDALALLRISASPDSVQSDEAVRRMINVPARGFGEKALACLEGEASWRQCSLLAAIETAPLPPRNRATALAFTDAIRGHGEAPPDTLADRLFTLLQRTGYWQMWRDSRAEEAAERIENLRELIMIAGGFHGARDLLDHAALASGGPGDERDVDDHIQMMTLHKSKGLEFDHVFLPSWEQGVFPPSFGDLAEERRLAYVALTRGRQLVTVSHAGFRYGKMQPSIFLDDIPATCRVDGWHSENGDFPSSSDASIALKEHAFQNGAEPMSSLDFSFR